MNGAEAGAGARPPIFVHPGFMKSATTTLQEHLFLAHSQIASIGRPHRRFEQRAIADELLGIDGVSFRPTVLDDLVRRELEQVLDEAPNLRCIVLSDETLLANAYLYRPIAERLRVVFPEAAVFITIRRQLDAIASYYARTGRVLFDAPRPFHERHVSLENWLQYAWARWDTSFLGQVAYRPAVETYERVFGSDRVRVFLFEELAHTPDRFLAALCALLGVDAVEAAHHLKGRASHRRESLRYVRYRRLLARLGSLIPAGVGDSPAAPPEGRLRRFGRRLVHRGRSFDVRIPEAWRERLNERYAPHNDVLARRYQLPLSRWGYPMPGGGDGL